MVNNPPLKLQETTSATTEVSIDQPPRLSIWTKDPWKIKKKLMAGDLENLNRLMLHSDQVEKYILPHLVEEELNIWDGHEVAVRVWDCDTQSEHQLVLTQCQSSMGYMLKDNWTSDFVKRRNLNLGDEVGLFWDASQGPDSLLIYFTVLHLGSFTSEASDFDFNF